MTTSCSIKSGRKEKASVAASSVCSGKYPDAPRCAITVKGLVTFASSVFASGALDVKILEHTNSKAGKRLFCIVLPFTLFEKTNFLYCTVALLHVFIVICLFSSKPFKLLGFS